MIVTCGRSSGLLGLWWVDVSWRCAPWEWWGPYSWATASISTRRGGVTQIIRRKFLDVRSSSQLGVVISENGILIGCWIAFFLTLLFFVIACTVLHW